MELQAEDKNLNGSNPVEKDQNEPDTLVDTLEMLKEQGFTYDFNLTAHALEVHSDEGVKFSLSPEDFNIVKVFRFEGMTDPSDMSILYAIESSNGLKGSLLSSYGVYADAMSNEMIKKLDTRSSIASFYPDNSNAQK